MKRISMMLVAATALLVSTVAFAQSGTYSASIPFEFRIGQTIMPAGAYRLSVVAPGVIALRAVTANANVTAQTAYIDEVRYNDRNPRLVFHRYGEIYFLSQVWSNTKVHELFVSPTELEFARSAAPTTVKIVAQEVAKK
jgi:hypothetical protein